MWRALFLAIGLSLFILGVECLAVSRFTFKAKADKVEQKTIQAPPPGLAKHRVLVVGDHAPWSLMGLGAVVVIYAYDLPKRMKG